MPNAKTDGDILNFLSGTVGGSDGWYNICHIYKNLFFIVVMPGEGEKYPNLWVFKRKDAKWLYKKYGTTDDDDLLDELGDVIWERRTCLDY